MNKPIDLVDAAKRKRKPSVAVLPGQFHLTDVGNAKRLVARHRDVVRYCPPRRRWFTWDGCRWVADETGEIVRLAKDTVAGIYEEGMAITDTDQRAKILQHAYRSEAAARLAAMITLAESEPGIPVLPADLDADPWLLNVSNGTLDLRTGELREHRRSDLITKLAPVEYRSGARSELWDRFLDTATGGDAELAAYLARVVGYGLQGTAREKCFFFLFGPPDTSKSTFVDAVAGALGDYHLAAAFDTWLQQTNTGGNRDDLVRLAGVRIVTSVEVRPGVKFDAALVKRITGGDLVAAAAKYEHEIQFVPQMTIVLAANDAPAIRDDDDGMWSRVRRIPFGVVIPPESRDPFLREKLSAPEAQSAILAWAVAGCRDWLEHGLGSCAAVEESSAEYRESQDRVAGFFSERCYFGPAERVAVKAIGAAYLAWCEENHVRQPLTSKELAERLTKRGCRPGKVKSVRDWRGIRLLRDDEDPGGTGGHEGTAIPQNSPMRDHSDTFPDLVSPAVPLSPAEDDRDDQETFAGWVEREVGPCS